MNEIANLLKFKSLRVLAKLKSKKYKNKLERLEKDERFVYDIAVKMLTSYNSILEYSPETDKFYAKNGSNLVKLSTNSIHFINEEHSYSFYYDTNIMENLLKIYYRRKRKTINEYSKQISDKSTVFLKNICVELNKN